MSELDNVRAYILDICKCYAYGGVFLEVFLAQNWLEPASWHVLENFREGSITWAPGSGKSRKML